MSKKTYAITGVSNGIGRELARLLSGEGHRVLGLDIAPPSDPLEKFIELDLTSSQSIAAACAEIPPSLDGICNCAGLPPREGLESKILKVNFFGTRSFTNQLQDKLQIDASVVNLASRAGHGWPDGIDQVKRLAELQDPESVPRFVREEKIDPVRAYDLSKEAIILWTMASSETYLNRSMRINSISPGAVKTQILDDFQTAFGDRMTKNVKRAGRAGTATEIAELAAFLLSPKSSWIKGTDISIDGGMSAFANSDRLALAELIG